MAQRLVHRGTSRCHTGPLLLPTAQPAARGQARRRVVQCVATSSDPHASSKTIILYSKPDCPLCDGTKERIEGLIARSEFMPSCLTGYALEVRDITSNPEWASAYAMEVPVLKALAPDGSEVPIPRPPPRMTTDKLLQHLGKTLPQ